jgi:serine/threonine-protein kinase
MVGTSIGKYRVVELLGSGAMGKVYKAIDETLDREVAIKILNPELADADLMRRFRTEATTLARLNHPEIATIHELLRSDQDVVMVMELVRGESLDRMLERLGALPPERVAYLVDRVLSALDHAHLAGIVHRDMKPANVMVTASGGIKIMDFGVAFIRGAEHVGAVGGMVGTPAYMPPEQILGHDVDGRADLYAVGVIFYRLLTGAFPFSADTMEDMLRKQLSDLPTPLRQHRDGLPAWCEGIVQRALAKSPADRFQAAKEFRSALKDATRTATERTSRLSASAFGRLGLAPPKVPASTSTAGAAVGLRRPWVAWAGAAFAIIAMGIVALAYSTQWRLAPDGKTSMEPTAPPATTPPVPSAPAVLPPAVLPPAVSTPSGAARRNPPAASAAVAPGAPSKAVDQTATPGRVDTNASAIPLDAPPSSESNAARGAQAFLPLVFDARALVGIGDRQREREVNVQLADGNVTVTAAAFPNDVVHHQSYDAILSIAYSRSRHPLWISPDGPASAARTGRVLGIFPRSRHWVTLHSRDAADSLIVLRLENDGQAKRVIGALEERTRRHATLVVEPKDPK